MIAHDGADLPYAQAPAGWSDVRGTAAPGPPPADWPNRTAVLFDDSRSGRAARLYVDPSEVVVAHRIDEIADALERVRDRVAQGRHAAGFMAYEAGAAFEPRLAIGRSAAPGAGPLLWFGIFDGFRHVSPEHLSATRRVPLQPVPAWSPSIYRRRVRRVLDFIGAGDCYQVNLTFPNTVSLPSAPWQTYLALRAGQRCGWGGYLNGGGLRLLSCSPEMFFAQDGPSLSARPMKGTVPRIGEPGHDAAARRRLESSEKDRAENLMIVDLLRNDLSRVAVPGSVTVPALFEIETYPTVYQMTSTILATMRDGIDAIDVLRATFPCGSVTGAPKVRAMEIIRLLETRARGTYTGSLGFIDPCGTSAFNVLIRTLELSEGDHDARLGLGSAIVADSDPAAEWDECMAKAAFLAPGR